MKNIDLKQMGVQEMDAVEIVETEGGLLMAAACIILAGVYLAATIGSLYYNGDYSMSTERK